MSTTRSREQLSTVIYGILCIGLVLVILQLWLLAAPMNAHLGGDESIIWPTAFGSAVCFLLNVGLLLQIYKLER